MMLETLVKLILPLLLLVYLTNSNFSLITDTTRSPYDWREDEEHNYIL